MIVDLTEVEKEDMKSYARGAMIALTPKYKDRNSYSPPESVIASEAFKQAEAMVLEQRKRFKIE